MIRVIFSALILSLLISTSNMAAANNQPNNNVVRLAVVNTPAYSGLMDHLLKEFEQRTGLAVEVYSGSDVYDRAKNGEADIVISHFGKNEVEEFVLKGYGQWPVMVFSNQAALIGPKSDPAEIRGFTNASIALQRIESTSSTYIINRIPGVFNLTEMLIEISGLSGKGAWIVDDGVAKAKALKLAEEKQGYVIWGALPFLKFKEKSGSDMEILVSSDPMLQRIMSLTIVNPQKVKGVNSDGAEALQAYLLEAQTQAKIAAYRTPGSDQQLWWPAARDN